MCRPQRSRLRGPTGAIPARSRAFAAAADVWFGDDDSAARAIVRPSREGQFWPTDGLCSICDPVHRREDGRQLKIVRINFDGSPRVKQTGPTWREAKAATLRVRYAELLRFREYVQRQEALCQDAAEPKEGNLERVSASADLPASLRAERRQCVPKLQPGRGGLTLRRFRAQPPVRLIG